MKPLRIATRTSSVARGPTGSFALRAIVEPGTVLVAVRGDASSAPVPWTGTMHDLVLVLQ